MKKIKILVITYLPWREDNSIGNSYSNIFRGTEDKYEFAHIYFRDGMPQNNLVHEFYHISEKKLLNRLLLKKEAVGHYFHLDRCEDLKKDEFSKLYNKARILRWEIFFWLREIAGMTNCWKTPDFEDFLNRFNPDLVFGTLSAYPIISNMMCYISRRRNIPLITYPWDDHYTFNRISWSPIYWIRKLQGRYYQRKSVKQSTFMYVISDLMKVEYERIFKKECKILFKGHVFDLNHEIQYIVHKPINLVYMGNIGCGRWKTLAFLANTIKYVNEKYGEQRIVLNIYTLSPKDSQIEKALNILGTTRLNESVPNDQVEEVMHKADILVHAEPFEKKDYQFYRASFSTKLVDYFFEAKPILSIGGITASTDYLIKNDATLYATKEEVPNLIQEFIDNPAILYKYAKKSWECGKKNHQIDIIQERVHRDFIECINKHRKI